MTTKKEREIKKPIKRQVLIASFLFVFVLCLLSSVFSFELLRNVYMEQYQSRIEDTLRLTIAQIDTEDLKSCIDSGNKSEKFEQLTQYMNSVRETCDLDYLVICKPVRYNDGSYDVIQVVSGLLEEEISGEVRIEGIEIPELGDKIGAMYPEELREELYQELDGNGEVKFSNSKTDFGQNFGGSLTIFDKDGKGISLISTGITVRSLNRTLVNYFFIILTISIVLGLIFQLFMNIWISKRVLNPLKKIEESANDFALRAHGQLDPAILVMKRPDVEQDDELGSLADTLVSMSKDMRSYVEDLLANASKIRNMQHEITRISDIAMKDTLTGVHSKAAFEKRKNQLDSRIKKGIARFGVVMFDLNELKKVNDTYGHDKGDIYLINASKAICETFNNCLVYRNGGDEFVAIMDDDLDNIKQLEKQFKSRMINDKKPWENVSIAMGYALYEKDKDSFFEDVLKRADHNMYERKKEMKKDDHR